MFKNEIRPWVNRRKQDFPKSIKQWIGWIKVSYGVLPILIAGNFWVLLSQSPESGALLVGCSIISQARLQMWPLAGFLGGHKSRAQIVHEHLNPRMQNAVVTEGNIEPLMNALKIIAVKNELEFGIKKVWLMELTILRVFIALEWCIMCSALLGTIIWAYT